MTNSLWLTHREPIKTDLFVPDDTSDVLVVGAGLTGLTTALLLRRAGLKVTVIEARSVGAVTTGHTTAKLSLLQGTILSGMRKHFSQEIVNAYVEANLEGQAWLLRYLEEHKVAVQQRDAFTYTTDPSRIELLEHEVQIAQNAGLDVHWAATDIGLPFPVQAALRLKDQAQFDPMDVLETLASDLRSRGVRIVEGVRVRKATSGSFTALHTDQGTNRAQHVVLATGFPILDRGLYFAKLTHSRSYVAAYRMPSASGSLPENMYLSVDQPTRSLRTVPQHNAPDLLLVGGNDHPVGKRISESEQLKDLDDWAQQHFPGVQAVHQWSAQDYQSANMVPFVGKLPRSSGSIHVATGYNKWGMTNAVAAALQISSNILGGSIPWAETLSHRITSPRDLAEGAKFNAGVARKLLTGWNSALFAQEASIQDSTRDAAKSSNPVDGPSDEPKTEQGSNGWVRRQGLKPVAISTTAGKTCQVSAVCSHLGGILSWNDAEESWDCPLHGSRFSPTGQVLEGPATQDLKTISPDESS